MADGVSPKDDAVRVPSVHSWKARIAAVCALIVVGLALIVFASVLWLSDGSPADSTTHKRDTTKVSGSAAGGSGGTTPKLRSACRCKAKGKTVVISTQTTSGGGPSKRSETLVLALYGLGILLFLCGVFFGRIQEVTLPGGAGLKIASDAQEKVKSTVEKVAKESDAIEKADSATIKILVQMTLGILLAGYQARAAVAKTDEGFYVVGAPVISEFPEEKVEQAAEQAAEQLGAVAEG